MSAVRLYFSIFASIINVVLDFGIFILLYLIVLRFFFCFPRFFFRFSNLRVFTRFLLFFGFRRFFDLTIFFFFDLRIFAGLPNFFVSGMGEYALLRRMKRFWFSPLVFPYS